MGTFDYSNTAPVTKKLPYLREVTVKSTGNVSLSACPATIDDITFSGSVLDGNNNTLVFLNSQSTAAENGVYMLDQDTGTIVSISGSFSGGSYTLSGLTNDALYACRALATTVTAVGNGSTSSTFTADPSGEYWAVHKASGSGTLVFTGPSSGSASGLIAVYPVKLTIADVAGEDDEHAVGNLVVVLSGTAGKGLRYKLTAISAAGVRTYTATTAEPSEPLMHYVRRAPEAITP